MSNPHRGQAEVELGGRRLTLTIDYNKLAEIEEATGVSFMAGGDDLKAKVSTVRFVRDAVAIACSTRGRAITPSQVGDWLSETGKIIEAGIAVNTAIARFFSGALPQKDSESSAHPTIEPNAPGSTGQG